METCQNAVKSTEKEKEKIGDLASTRETTAERSIDKARKKKGKKIKKERVLRGKRKRETRGK